MAQRIGGITSDLYLTAQHVIRSGLIVNREIWGRQSTTRGAEIWVPKRGSFWLLKMSQNQGYPQWYISTPAWRSDPPCHMLSTKSSTVTHMYLAPKDLHGPRRGDDPNWVHKCQNGKIGRLGRPSRVENLGDIKAPSLDSQPFDIPFGPMPWVMARCHTGCLLFIEGMNTRMGQKAACGATGEIMDRTKS